MPNMRKGCSLSYFVPSDKIQTCFQFIEDALIQENNLKTFSDKEFVLAISEIFASINQIHAFREGNGRVQRMFCEKIAEASGRTLDFSLATKARMEFVSAQIMEYNNIEPMVHLFEDISNPDKRVLLREFIDFMKPTCDIPNSNCYLVAAEEGKTYMGQYRGAGLESFTIKTYNSTVICKKEEIAPELLKTLKYDDPITFTAKTNSNILIPAENLQPLTQSEIREQASKIFAFKKTSIK
ncbi:Fic family protein [Bartonella ancashensis]|nr:Fic family protein [Bartonella ancashensis]